MQFPRHTLIHTHTHTHTHPCRDKHTISTWISEKSLQSHFIPPFIKWNGWLLRVIQQCYVILIFLRQSFKKNIKNMLSKTWISSFWDLLCLKSGGRHPKRKHPLSFQPRKSTFLLHICHILHFINCKLHKRRLTPSFKCQNMFRSPSLYKPEEPNTEGHKSSLEFSQWNISFYGKNKHPW